MGGDLGYAGVEYAAVFEVLRYPLRRLVVGGATVAELSRLTSVPPSTLHAFLQGRKIKRGTWDALTAFHEHVRPPIPDQGVMGLAVVVDTLPLRLRNPAREWLALALAGLLDGRGEPTPEWLEEELEGWRRKREELDSSSLDPG